MAGPLFRNLALVPIGLLIAGELTHATPSLPDGSGCADGFRALSADATRILFSESKASGNTLVLDSNLAQTYFQSIMQLTLFSDSPASAVRLEFHSLREKISSGLIDEDKLLRSASYASELLAAGTLTPTQLQLSRMDARIHYGAARSYLGVLGEHLESASSLKTAITPTILQETFSSEYDLIGKELRWRGPNHVLAGLLESPTISIIQSETSLLAMEPSIEATEKSKFLQRLHDADLGGNKGDSDRQIISEIRFAAREPNARIGFATADVGLVRGLLRIHLGSNYNGDQLLKKLRLGTQQEIAQLPGSISVVDFPFSHRFGDWREKSVSQGRMVVLKDLDLGGGRKIDLYAFFESP